MARYDCYCPRCQMDVTKVGCNEDFLDRIACPHCGYPMKILQSQTNYDLERKIDELWEKNDLLKNEILQLKGEINRLKSSNKVLKRDNKKLNRKINLKMKVISAYEQYIKDLKEDGILED